MSNVFIPCRAHCVWRHVHFKFGTAKDKKSPKPFQRNIAASICLANSGSSLGRRVADTGAAHGFLLSSHADLSHASNTLSPGFSFLPGIDTFVLVELALGRFFLLSKPNARKLDLLGTRQCETHTSRQPQVRIDFQSPGKLMAAPRPQNNVEMPRPDRPNIAPFSFVLRNLKHLSPSTRPAHIAKFPGVYLAQCNDMQRAPNKSAVLGIDFVCSRGEH